MPLDYQSPQVIPRGERNAEIDVDAAIRKNFKKDRGTTLILAVNDLFNSRRQGTIYDTRRFYQES